VERPKDLDPTDLTATEEIGPEDTLDGECSELLERAYSAGNHASGMASSKHSQWEPDCLLGWRDAETSGIDGSTASAGQIGLVLRESAEVLAYLQCDARSPDARLQRRLETLCLQNLGR
jgi:hypothetical protein